MKNHKLSQLAIFLGSQSCPSEYGLVDVNRENENGTTCCVHSGEDTLDKCQECYMLAIETTLN